MTRRTIRTIIKQALCRHDWRFMCHFDERSTIGRNGHIYTAAARTIDSCAHCGKFESRDLHRDEFYRQRAKRNRQGIA